MFSILCQDCDALSEVADAQKAGRDPIERYQMRTDMIVPSSPALDDTVASPLELLPSLWLHGAGLSGSTWGAMTDALPLAATPDLTAHASPEHAVPSSVEGLAGALLPHVPDGCVLIGHSLGGMVALELAIRAKNRVAALVLIESVPTVLDTRSGRLSGIVAKSIIRCMPLGLMSWLSGLGQLPETREELRRQLARHTKTSLAAAMEAAASYDGRDRLGLVTVPTQVIVGRRDRATHRGAQLSAHRICDAEFLQLDGGHILHMDNPVQLRSAIDDFLRRKL